MISANKSNALTTQKTINIRGRLVDLSTPRVMGIINLTPDSFFAGSRTTQLDEVLRMAEQMMEEGATFLDVGGYSTRPGAADISAEEELTRIVSPIQKLTKEFPEAVISIDTFRSVVARAAVEAGASIVNDVSGGDLDEKMMETVAALRVPYVAMHMRGTPQTMQQQTDYEEVVKEVTLAFSEKLQRAHEFGIHDMILDPGFGFAKTIEQNFQLLNQLNYLHHLGRPVLVGISRKLMICKTLKITPEQALNGTTVLNTVALLRGASILRVHDVKAAYEAVQLITQLTT